MNKPDFYTHSTATVDWGACIGDDTKIWHYSHIMSHACIGKRCIIGQNVFIGNGVVLGNGCKVQNNVSLYTGVTCEDDVFLGPSCVFTNVVNPRSFIERKSEFKSTLVKKGATIGANATIVCGVTIGEYAFVSAGSVVTKDVLPYSLVMGVPAEHKYYISVDGAKLLFDPSSSIAVCPLTGQSYRLDREKVIRID